MNYVVMVNVIVINVVMINVVMINVVMLNVAAPRTDAALGGTWWNRHSK